MKSFINNLKKSNKVYLVVLLISLCSYLVGYVIFIKNIAALTGIETLIRLILIILFGLWFLVWLIMGLVYLFNKKYSNFIIMIVFTVIFNVIFFVAGYYIDAVYKEIDGMSKDTLNYTSYLISMKDASFNSDSKVGIISDSNNIEGNVLAKELINKDKLANKLYQYDDFYAMLSDLYSGKIDACFVSSNYTILFSSEEAYQNIKDDTKVISSFSKEMKNQDNVIYSNKKLTEPFTILVMGVDSEVNGLNANGAFNGDTLMLVTFNPKTLSASMFSIPRDEYVPISCRNGALAKINSAAAYGINCVLNTVKNLTDVDIDYYVKMNFKGVVDLVEALGGITVDVEKPWSNWNAGVNYNGRVCEQNSNREFGDKVICMDPGVQVLNGEQALAYSRNRHQYIGSDLDRIRHQQDVVEAIIEKAKTLRSFDDFKNVLNAVQKNMDTNLTTEQILSLYEVGKSFLVNSLNGNDVKFSIYKTTLETYSLPVYLGYSTTSALGYYKDSLEDIKKMMKTNLGLIEKSPNKTFSVDYNEEYTTKYYGKKLYGEKSVATMPNLIGSGIDYVRNWADNNGVKLTVVEVYDGDEHFNYLYGDNIVADQSIHINTVINSSTNLTVYVNKRSSLINNDDNNLPERNQNDTVIDNEE
ncbi:MAG: LCP family protein [bacterium]|nr:LCP family protein [bacterium]